MVSVALFFIIFLTLYCIVVMIEGFGNLMTIHQPLGIHMCSSLCLSFDTCQSLSFDKEHLRCFLENTSVVSERLFHLLRKDINLYKTLTSYRKRGANSGYIHLHKGNTHMYVKPHDEIKSWDEALHVCQAEGGTLVKVDSRVKQNLLTEAFYSHLNVSEYRWIGLRDAYYNNTWCWTDGKYTNYTKWGFDEPNNDMFGKPEDCATMQLIPFIGVRWYDLYCYSLYKFLCEKDQG